MSKIANIEKKLQAIIDWFESTEDIDINLASKKYQEGEELIKQLEKELETAQNIIKKVADFSSERAQE